ncbi:DUF4347 domain-containing protein, partial [Arenibacterium sp. CAU 1754]
MYFVESTVPNVQDLIATIPDGAEVVVIEAGSDGVEQIADVLDGREDLDAIHILSHGEQGSLSLGNTQLTAESIVGGHEEALTTIGASLSEDGDILIYGCDFTGGENGLEAAMALGGVTGADIAASNDLTGHSDLGGDWDLETEIGQVESQSLSAESWQGVLAPTWSITGDTSVDEGNSATYTISNSEVLPLGTSASIDITALYGTADDGDFDRTLSDEFVTAINNIAITRDDLTFDGTTLTYTADYTGEVQGTENLFTDISGTGTGLNIGSNTTTLQSIGFNFEFYGVTYTQLFISDNGYVTFGGAFNSGNNVDMSGGTAFGGNPAIAAYWDGLNPNGVGSGDVFIQTTGAPGSQQFIIQWNDMTLDGVFGTESGTFQLILDEATGDIRVNFEDLDFRGTGNDFGRSATLGIQDGTGSAVQLNFNVENGLSNNSSALFQSPANGMDDLIFRVTTTGDQVVEGPESYSISLSNPVNSVLGTGTVTTIVDDAGSDVDGDTIADLIDVDDDNDGILDTVEGLTVGTQATSGAWTISGNTATVDLGNGIIIRATNTSGNFSAGNFNGAGAGFWSENLAGATSLQGVFTWDTSVTFTFENAAGDPIEVLNPILHLDRIGGQSGGLQNSASVELASGSWTRLAGTADFLVTGHSAQDGGAGTLPGATYSSESGADDANSTAAGSVQLQGLVSTFTIDFRQLAGFGIGDGIEFIMSATSYVALDTDGDGSSDHVDIDKDNDGITDNVEAQTTAGYIAPTGDGTITDTNNDGLDDVYDNTTAAGIASGATAVGQTEVDTDSDGTADTLDLDSDNDGLTDTVEAGHGVAQATIDASGDADGDGLKDVLDTAVGFDVNDDNLNASGEYTLADSDNDTDADGSNAAPTSVDLDFRDDVISIDTDGDGVLDTDDIDDDNDGILDVDEGAFFVSTIDLNVVSTIPGGTYPGDPQGIRLSDATGQFFLDIYEGANTSASVPFSFNTSTGEISSDGLNVSNSELVELVYTTQNSPVAFTFQDIRINNIESLTAGTFGVRDGYVWSETGTWTPVGSPAGAVVSVDPGAADGVGDFVITDPDGGNTIGDINQFTQVLAVDNNLSDVLLNMSGAADGHTADFLFDNPQTTASLFLFNAGSNNMSWGFFPQLTVTVNQTFGIDSDGDGLADHLDIDKDNDGITDNVEAQTTAGYIAPTGDGTITDTNNDGLDDVYDNTTAAGIASGATAVGLTEVDTDSDGTADTLDLDSDNDGLTDTVEAGHGVAQATIDASGDADGDGLKDVLDTAVGFDVNDDNLNASGEYTLADSDNDTDADGSNAAPTSVDLDFRDDVISIDTDGDGVLDTDDIDDDNDGILDVDELSTGDTGRIYWDHNSGGGTSYAALTDGSIGSILINANDISFGAGFTQPTSTFENILQGADSATFADAISGNDYVEVSFTLGQDAFLTDIQHGIVPVDWGGSAAGNYEVAVAISDDGFLSSTTIYDDGFQPTPPNGVYGISQESIAPYLLGAGTEYTVRFYLFNEQNSYFPDNTVAFDDLFLSISQPLDSDGDGIADHLDIDSDNDGITDNVEAQTTAGYIAPTGDGTITDLNGDGLDDVYGAGLTPVDTDGDGIVDVLDDDSDNDGLSDTIEAGHGVDQATIDASADTDGDGLKDVVEGADVADGFDVNDENLTGTTFNLADSDADMNPDGSNAAPLSTDFDYRDDSLPPVATPDAITVTEDTTATGNVITDDLGGGVDSDPNSDPLTVVAASIDVDGDGIANPLTLGAATPLVDAAGDPIGSITMNSDGSFSFTPALNYVGPVPQLNYTISDGDGGTDSSTLDITISPVNDAPVATDDAVVTDEDVPVSGNLITDDLGGGIDSDVDGDP